MAGKGIPNGSIYGTWRTLGRTTNRSYRQTITTKYGRKSKAYLHIYEAECTECGYKIKGIPNILKVRVCPQCREAKEIYKAGHLVGKLKITFVMGGNSFEKRKYGTICTNCGYEAIKSRNAVRIGSCLACVGRDNVNSYRNLSLRLGLSKERVRQIIVDNNLDTDKLETFDPELMKALYRRKPHPLPRCILEGMKSKDDISRKRCGVAYHKWRKGQKATKSSASA